MVTDALARIAGKLLSPKGEEARLMILFYHRVLAKPDLLKLKDLTSAQFERQMAALSRIFNVLPLEDGVERMMAGTLPSLAVSITFDDGYADNVNVAVPILVKYGLHATFYLTTGFLEGGLMYNDVIVEAVRRMADMTEIDLGFVGLGSVQIDGVDSRAQLIDRLVSIFKYLDPEARADACRQIASLASEPLPDHLMMRMADVQALVRHGMAIGGHTTDHPILATIKPDDAIQQITSNRDTLAKLLGYAPTTFAYPNGKPNLDYGPEHVEMVRQAGYKIALTTRFGCATRRSDSLQLPRISPWQTNEFSFVLNLLRLATVRPPA